MSEEQIKLELNKVLVQQQQWHDEFVQRERHWFWQKGFWCFMGGMATITIAISVTSIIIKLT